MFSAMASTKEPRRRGGAAKPLPSGRHNLPREFVIGSQRDRVLDAMATVCAEKGYAAATVADIVNSAHVSRSTFYELFRDKEACFLAAFDEVMKRLLSDLVRAAGRNDESDWAERIRAGLELMLAFLAAEPAFARMCLIDTTFAGPQARERYAAAIRVLTTFVDLGRRESPHGEELPHSLAAAIVGGGAVLVRDEILAGRIEKVGELLPDMVYLTLAPYLGREEALRRLDRSVPVPRLRVA
jgi:AcrR family transcriptional regulator